MRSISWAYQRDASSSVSAIVNKQQGPFIFRHYDIYGFYEKLVIPKIDFDGSGKYFCFSTSLGGEKSQQSVDVDVLSYGNDVVIDTIGNIQIGGDFTVTCRGVAAESDNIKVNWENPDKDGVVTGRIAFTEICSSHVWEDMYTFEKSLKVFNATNSDTGDYICNAENQQGFTWDRKEYVNVYDAAKTPPEPIIDQGVNFVVEDGDNFTLTCSAKYFEGWMLNLNWEYPDKFDGRIAIDETVYSKTGRASQPCSEMREEVNYKVSRNLRIFNSQDSDSGNYICKAENPHGLLGEAIVHVKIIDAAKMYPEPNVDRGGNFDVHVGGNFTLTCSAVYFFGGTVNLTWKYPDKPGVLTERVVITETIYSEVDQGVEYQVLRNLTVFNAQDSDSGDYLCTAENRQQLTREAIQYVKVFAVEPQPTINREGNNDVLIAGKLILTCSAIYPAGKTMNLSWVIPDETGVADGRITIKETVNSENYPKVVYQAVTQLIINNANTSDSGNYICRAENHHGLTAEAVKFVKILSVS